MRSTTTKRLLVVEDDRPIAELLKFHFTGAGFTVTSTPSGDEALILIEEIRPDLVILDWMIEGTSGIEVCRRVRRSNATATLPIIMLTARGDEEDRIRGLETGADDFVSKPFSPKELLARANALLRRSAPDLMAEKLSYGGIELDAAAHRVRRNERAVSLGPTEYRLLHHFLRNPERVYSRQQLLEIIWPHNEEVELRTVDVLIRRLRVALGPGDDVIRTVRSEGYSLDTCLG
jgi:two-component system phosphate regulon response regulator PhoB